VDKQYDFCRRRDPVRQAVQVASAVGITFGADRHLDEFDDPLGYGIPEAVWRRFEKIG
jgi:hypothetical protein